MVNQKLEISNAFGQHAKHYDDFANIQTEIGKRLLARLEIFKMRPTTILDVGCGTGTLSFLLAKRYPDANIFSLDYASPMLACLVEKTSKVSAIVPIQGDMEFLPFQEKSIELIVMNQVLHWGLSPARLFSELQRVLKPGGILLFSTLGPDTFRELREAFLSVDSYQHTNVFRDMHDIGDELCQAVFDDVVLDMEEIAVHYNSIQGLLNALKHQGVRNLHEKRRPGLMGKAAWRAFFDAYTVFQTDLGKYPLTYEVIYGHAIRPLSSKAFFYEDEPAIGIDANAILFQSTRGR